MTLHYIEDKNVAQLNQRTAQNQEVLIQEIHVAKHVSMISKSKIVLENAEQVSIQKLLVLLIPERLTVDAWMFAKELRSHALPLLWTAHLEVDFLRKIFADKLAIYLKLEPQLLDFQQKKTVMPNVKQEP